MPAFLAALTAVCNAYVARLEWERHTEIEKIEDEILSIGIPTSPALKLRIDLLVKRKQRKLEQISPV
jgi:hypothetical protein